MMAQVYSISRLVDEDTGVQGKFSLIRKSNSLPSTVRINRNVAEFYGERTLTLKSSGKKVKNTRKFDSGINKGLPVSTPPTYQKSKDHLSTHNDVHSSEVDAIIVGNGFKNIFTLDTYDTEDNEPPTDEGSRIDLHHNGTTLQSKDDVKHSLQNEHTHIQSSGNNKSARLPSIIKKNISQSNSLQSDLSKCNSIPDMDFCQPAILHFTGKRDRVFRQSFADVVTEVIQGPIKEDIHPFGRGHLYGNALGDERPKIRREEGQWFIWVLIILIMLGIIGGIVFMARMSFVCCVFMILMCI